MNSPDAAPALPSSIGLNPLDHEWVADVNFEDEAVFYVRCVTGDGQEFAHVLFEADWADFDHAEHIVRLHNAWLAKRKEAGLVA